MKKLSLLISLLLVLFYSNAQETPLIDGQALGEIKNPLEWEGSIKKISDTDYELSLTGYIDDNWHVYSQHTLEDLENGLGPIPLFIDLTALKISTCVIFTATLIGVDLIVMTGYTMLAEISKSLLSDPQKILWQNRVTGLTLIFVGLIMGNA